MSEPLSNVRVQHVSHRKTEEWCFDYVLRCKCVRTPDLRGSMLQRKKHFDTFLNFCCVLLLFSIFCGGPRTQELNSYSPCKSVSFRPSGSQTTALQEFGTRFLRVLETRASVLGVEHRTPELTVHILESREENSEPQGPPTATENKARGTDENDTLSATKLDELFFESLAGKQSRLS